MRLVTLPAVPNPVKRPIGLIIIFYGVTGLRLRLADGEGGERWEGEAQPLAGLNPQHFPHLAGEGVDGEGFGDHRHVWPEKVAGGCAFGVAGGEQYFQAGAVLVGDFCELAAIHAGQADIADQQIDALGAFDDGQRFGGVAGLEGLVAQVVEHFDDEGTDHGFVLDDQDGFAHALSG
jgi:hypothetical protein